VEAHWFDTALAIIFGRVFAPNQVRPEDREITNIMRNRLSPKGETAVSPGREPWVSATDKKGAP